VATRRRMSVRHEQTTWCRAHQILAADEIGAALPMGVKLAELTHDSDTPNFEVDLRDVLGSGSYGAVVAATQEVVVKVADLSESEDDVDAFAREITFAKLASEKRFGPRFAYARIVRGPIPALGVLERPRDQAVRGRPMVTGFLVTARWTGSLLGLMKHASGSPRRPASMSDVLSVDMALKLKDQIERMHALGLAHGDLAPRNVLVNTDEARSRRHWQWHLQG